MGYRKTDTMFSFGIASKSVIEPDLVFTTLHGKPLRNLNFRRDVFDRAAEEVKSNPARNNHHVLRGRVRAGVDRTRFLGLDNDLAREEFIIRNRKSWCWQFG